jgi:F-type H+-transporting ATPase subunit alpha
VYDNSVFEQLVNAGNATGEVIGLERFLVKVKGLEGAPVGALVMFDSGHQGIVREITVNHVVVLNLEAEVTAIGALAVLQELSFTALVGEGLIGRVVSPLGQALDGKGEIQYADTRDAFSMAPGLSERSMLNDQLPSGVSMVDMLFPIVLGQRIAVMGDTKSGKTSFLMQLGASQINTDRIVVYVLIGKRRIEVDSIVNSLNASGAMENSIVVVASVFDSLAQSYIAPYVGCAIAEYLWYAGRDVVVIYDDLTSHAKVYREVSLLAHANPGRDSYPGDMFHAHSSLLERAGKLSSNGKTLTALPVVLTPGDDITAYLPTSIMSITDGQIIFDLATFRRNVRPAVNAGLSVSRVGGRAQTQAQKELSGALFKKLAEFRQAQELANFGTDVSPETRQALELGKQLTDALRQIPSDIRAVTEQQLALRTIMIGNGEHALNIDRLKTEARDIAPTITNDEEIEKAAQQLLVNVTMEMGTS